MEKITLSIPNISCGHCVNTIKNELLEIDGVSSVDGDPEARQVAVAFESPATIEKIHQTLKEIDYPAE
ncbi:MAG: heavy-metal-associated domain-containing protein [Desulfosalsimonadaceae bacterium]